MASQDPAAARGTENTKLDTSTTSQPAADPFAAHRKTADGAQDASAAKNGTARSLASPDDNRRLSDDNWDASKVPPSQFQKRKGSIYATPSSRDSHVGAHAVRDEKFHALVDAKYGDKKGPKARRGSKSQE